MNGNIYDNTDWVNDSNPYRGNHNTGYDGNYDFCFDNDYSGRSLPLDYFELSYRMEQMEKMLHDIRKKGKKHKKKKKKRHNKSQKLKKRLRTIEKQNACIAECLVATMTQTQNADKYAWLKKSVENSAPNIVDLVSNVMTSKKRPLCLPDKSSMK